MGTTDTVHVSLVHARFAADLLESCQSELLNLAKTLDFYREFADRRPDDPAWTAIAASAPGNRDQLVAAAAYFLWLSDQIRAQCARLKTADVAASAGYYPRNSDEHKLASLKQQRLPPEVVQPPKDAPQRPAGLDSTIAMLPAEYLAKLGRARSCCEQALWAAKMSTTASMATVCKHIEMLLRWLEG
jgi:hypothetical protein